MTTIPAAVTALVAVFAAAAPTSLKVFDGPTLDPPLDFLCVGWDGGAGAQEAVTASESFSDYGLTADLEAYDVVCYLSVERGSAKTGADVRIAVYGYFEALKEALRADPHLDDLVMLARVNQHVYSQWDPSTGSGGRIQFNVHVEASAA